MIRLMRDGVGVGEGKWAIDPRAGALALRDLR